MSDRAERYSLFLSSALMEHITAVRESTLRNAMKIHQKVSEKIQYSDVSKSLIFNLNGLLHPSLSLYCDQLFTSTSLRFSPWGIFNHYPLFSLCVISFFERLRERNLNCYFLKFLIKALNSWKINKSGFESKAMG